MTVMPPRKRSSEKPTKATPAKPAADSAVATRLFEQYWQNPDDKDVLRVWADALAEQGDPRGELVHLSLIAQPTDEQREARVALLKKAGGKLVGPAREFLREWSFGSDGLVEAARAEADKVAAGIEAIGRVHPHLVLTITSLKKKPVIEAFSKISLERIYFVDFTSITGSHGGTPLSTRTLAAIAPALARVRHLALSCRGYADDCFTPEGLLALGEACRALEVLAIDYYQAGAGPYEDPARPRLPPAEEYARVIAESPGFAGLKALHLADVTPASLGPRAKIKLNRGPRPSRARELEALKRDP